MWAVQVLGRPYLQSANITQSSGSSRSRIRFLLGLLVGVHLGSVSQVATVWEGECVCVLNIHAAMLGHDGTSVTACPWLFNIQQLWFAQALTEGALWGSSRRTVTRCSSKRWWCAKAISVVNSLTFSSFCLSPLLFIALFFSNTSFYYLSHFSSSSDTYFYISHFTAHF